MKEVFVWPLESYNEEIEKSSEPVIKTALRAGLYAIKIRSSLFTNKPFRT